MKTPLRTSAPWIVLAVTAVLCVAFWLPYGNDGRNKTTYSPFVGLVTTFAAAQASLNAHLGTAAAVPNGPEGLTTSGRTALSAGSRAAKGRAAGRRRASRKGLPERPLHPAPPESTRSPSDTQSPLEGIPVPPPAAGKSQDDYSPDAIRDAFEAELSKFPLDAKATVDRVALRLVGLCRWRGHYILKVAVENQTAADFFVKELSAYAGSDFVTLKSYFGLLVEPGRTREGHVLFDAPAGARIKITLKEDRENGRVLPVPVRYPF